MDSDDQILEPVAYKPFKGKTKKLGRKISTGALLACLCIVIAVTFLLYLTMARSLIVNSSTPGADISISGLSFNIGSNFLLLPGDHDMEISAQGYHSLNQQITITDASTQEIDVVLEPLPGDLIVQSRTPDMTVSVDGEPLDLYLPGIIKGIKRGQHSLTFSSPRYFDKTVELEIEGLGKQQSLEVSLEPAWGHLMFTSEPTAAMLHVNGTEIGQTPIRAEILETGSQVKLSKPGYKTWDQGIRVKAGADENYPLVKLFPADGIAIIKTQPSGATVTLDGQFLGSTPLEVEVSPNEDHIVKLFLKGYRKSTESFIVKPEQQIRLDIVLKENTGEVKLSVTPTDSDIYIDGKLVGRGNMMLQLPSMQQTLTVRSNGYQSQTLEVLPKPGRQQALSVNLVTEEEAYWASRPSKISAFGDIPLTLIRPDKPFMLGAPRRQPGRRANEIERSVVLKRPFYIATKETSNRQYKLWRAEHSSSAIAGQTLDLLDQPAGQVSWEEAAQFCNWLSDRENLPRFYVFENGRIKGIIWSSNGYRLPTEAEWAYAARIRPDQSTAVFAWNDGLYPPEQAAGNYADASAARLVRFVLSGYDDGFSVSAPVGSFPANARGLHDTGGNVAEWVNDFYDVQSHRGDPIEDPRGPDDGVKHVIRGASWALGSRSELRLTYRDSGKDGRLDVGFRIARYVDVIAVEDD
jgi:formylglycine-generating enzyme required for sulfatase activity